MSLLRKMKAFGDRPATTQTVSAIFGLTAVLLAVVLLVFDQRSGDRFEAERADRGSDNRAQDRRTDRLDRRLVRVELSDPALCKRSPGCKRAVREREAPPRRDKRKAKRHEPVADRPPRQPAKPPTIPESDTGGGDPPNDPTPSAPAGTPPASPSPVVQIDPPPVDVDGPDGLLPDIVNLPRIDVPPVRLP